MVLFYDCANVFKDMLFLLMEKIFEMFPAQTLNIAFSVLMRPKDALWNIGSPLTQYYRWGGRMKVYFKMCVSL